MEYSQLCAEEENLGENLFLLSLSRPVRDPRRAWFMTSPANYHEAGPDTQGDITDIDSIIEINGRGIVTTVETQWFITGQMQGTTTAVSVVVEKKYPGNGTSWDHKVSWTRLNVSTGEGLIYSRSGRIVTNLRDRVTVRLTTTRRCNAAS